MVRPSSASRSNPAGEGVGPGQSNWNRTALLAGLLVAAVFLSYLPAWRGGFLWDDDAHVTRPELRSVSGLGRIWSDPWATQQFYPVLHSAFWVQHRWFGDNPVGYHAVNLGLHALNALLLWALVRRLAGPATTSVDPGAPALPPGAAWLAAGIFALHPVMVESVAWITELKNTLSGAFYLGAALAYLRFDRGRERRWYALAAGLFLLALGTKTVTATLPAALLVVFWWRRGRISWRSDVLPLLPFLLVGGTSGLFTAWVEANLIGAAGPEYALTLLERGLLAGRVICFYAAKFFWPVELSFTYPRWEVSARSAAQFIFPVIVLVVLGAMWVRRARGRGPLAGTLVFIGTLFPVLGFFNIFPFVFSYVADHFLYLASIGLIVPSAVGLSALAGRLGPPHGAVVGVGLLLALGLMSFRQSRDYRDAETLYRATLARNPAAWMAHLNLGMLLDAQGRTDEAVARYRRALQLRPGSAIGHLNLGIALATHGNLADGIVALREALRLKPGYAKAHQNLGAALLLQGKVPEALLHFSAAVRFAPGPATHRAYGLALLQAGRPAEAARQFEEALHGAPGHAELNALLQRARAQARGAG